MKNGLAAERLEATTLEKGRETALMKQISSLKFSESCTPLKRFVRVMMFDDIIKLAHKLEVCFIFIQKSSGQRSAHGAGRTHFSGVGFYIGEFDKIRDGVTRTVMPKN